MKIRFLGAVRGVTGSSHLIQANDKKILLDCGMYQGKDEDLNYEEFEFNPSEIDYLLLSHSHIDHSGRIPLLVKKGFRGKIYCSKPAYDLCGIMLMDSAHIQESEAEWKNVKARRSGRALVEPMYTQEDAELSLKYFYPVLYDQIINIDENITVRFKDAGHILGSAITEVWINEEGTTTKLVYSGDLGMKDKALLRDPSIIESADYLIIESTYGNRLHENLETRTEGLVNIILDTVERGGSVIIPSFAVGRTQEIIYELNKFLECHADEKSNNRKKFMDIPVYIDSPLATKATEIFKQNANVFDDEARRCILEGDNPLEFENLHFTQSVEESKILNASKEPKIIISASGMCEAGRIKHHLKHHLWKKESSIVFVGYQAEGTLGRKLIDGEKYVKVLGEEIRVNAQIHNVQGFSGHADKNALLEWLRGFSDKPKKVFLVHGEAESKLSFAEEIEKTLKLSCIIPEYNKVYETKKQQVIKEIAVEEVEETRPRSIDVSQIEDLKKEIEKIKEIFEKTMANTKDYIEDDNLNAKKYKDISNNILALENEILNLSMASTK
ncbi:MBL fold metallo-hydrolase RNA specificity domain-containing protein [Sedimentibacter saalensis]|uniref:Metallo-beta-lactamase family protein n=1 Tax=Sedimentibacter saalensis TaxID=130788 RepID=A0A562JHU3_9FIRM|nr:MBL fold metallo-hydrolase [Sedimentibacter saalensis]TWH82711.1 metallo-beta-lactamase family protein [Sedimentibacter saalensis]